LVDVTSYVPKNRKNAFLYHLQGCSGPLGFNTPEFKPFIAGPFIVYLGQFAILGSVFKFKIIIIIPFCFVLGRNRIKYLSSLKIKKYRNQHRQFIAEGDKIVKDILREGRSKIRQLIATREWLESAGPGLTQGAAEIIEADKQDIARISSLETPSMVVAVMDMPEKLPDFAEISSSWSIVLDCIQDPGNLGTIIRTADWFGIRHILCSEDCADCFNPKVVQASMGALFHVNIYYGALPALIRSLTRDKEFTVYGTFMEGIPFREIQSAAKGIIVFGNESRGISEELFPFIGIRITVPPANEGDVHVESLNVASAVAVVCSMVKCH
jgi:RNA methyltransferase, TrmH family